MPPSSKDAVLAYLRRQIFATLLDAPSGNGWLAQALPGKAVDGIDLFVEGVPGCRRFWKFNLDDGLPPDCDMYDVICCCEGLEHVGNPLRLLRDCHRHLKPGGRLIVTTPNVWYPQARLQFLLRGFFPSFPALADRVVPGTHMHITPWSFPQLYVYLRLAEFNAPEILPEPLSRAKHLHERLLAMPARLYCRSKCRRARSDEERRFWEVAGSDASLLGRHLIVVTQPAASR